MRCVMIGMGGDVTAIILKMSVFGMVLGKHKYPFSSPLAFEL